MITRTELISEVGLTRKAIRVYEKSGLICPDDSCADNNSLYDDENLRKARLIKKLRGANLPVPVIKSILDSRSDDHLEQLNEAIDAVQETFEAAGRPPLIGPI